MTSYFYDSFAIIEYIQDNPVFRKYFEEHSGNLSLLNLLEVYFAVLSDAGREKADIVLEKLNPLVVQPVKEEIQQAMVFRLENKKRDLSYADCLGYAIARRRFRPFLTGDKAFKGIEGVEFVGREDHFPR